MKNIIFPTDFSACAESALTKAIDLAKITGAKLNVIHAYHEKQIVEITPGYEAVSDYTLIEDKMNVIRETLKEHTLNFDCHIENGFLLEVMEKVIMKNPSSIILMGTKGAGTISFSEESHTKSLMEHYQIPLLSIPASFKGTLEKGIEIIFPVGFELINDWEVLDVLKEFALKLKAKLTIFCIVRSELDKHYQQDTFEKLQEYFEGIKFDIVFAGGRNISSEIEKFSINKKASIIAMVRHQRNYLEEVFHNSVTKDMILHSHIPCLVMPDAQG